MSLVLGLVVGCVKIVHAAFQARFHYGEVLIGERHVYHYVGFVAVEELAQLLNGVGVDLVGGYASAAYLAGHFLALGAGA